MIPERAGITVDSTVQGEDVAMRIDQSALVHLMNILTDLYQDAELAAIREYATNALDSHIEAGQSRPIEITTPTALRALLTIRDYGIGLDADDIRDVYSQYGKSTKRSTNDAVGMLGLGCKSALAYVDQFTLAGIKDGQRTLVSIARDETGAGMMKVMEAGPTDEPDGVEICIPTDDQYSLETKAKDFLSYWQPGLVLLNGSEPAQLEGYEIGDAYLVTERDRSYGAPGRHDARPLTVVMGNVSYPPPDGFVHPAVDSLPPSKRLVLAVPIGTVHFTPSRESLQDTPQTHRALNMALEDFEAEVAAAVTDAIVDAPDRPHAAKALIEARAAFGNKIVPDLQWEGEDIPVVLSAEDLPKINGQTPASLWAAKVVNSYSGGASHRYPAGQISLDDAGKSPWVLSYNNGKWTATQRRKLERYLAHHELNDSPHKATIFITDADRVPRPEWIDGAVTAVVWKDVREWKDPLKVSEGGGGRGGVKFAGTYPTYEKAEGHIRWFEKFASDNLPTKGRNLYYVDDNLSLANVAVNLLGANVFVVNLAAARKAKFLRLFPHARSAYEATKKGAMGWYKSLSEESRIAISLGPELRFRYIGPIALPPGKVDDPELSTLCRAYQLWESGKLRERYQQRAPFITIPDDAPTLNHAKVCGRYPLISEELDSTIEGHEDHAILYVNAVYAANEGSK